MNKQYKLNDKVTINSRCSSYHGLSGVITEIVDTSMCDTVFPYTVLLDCGEENYFSEDELK